MNYVFIHFGPKNERIVHTIQVHFSQINLKQDEIDYLCSIIGHEDDYWLKKRSFIIRKTICSANGAAFMLSVFPNPLSADEDIAGFVVRLVSAIEVERSHKN